MKKIVVLIVVLVLAGAVGYWGWNQRSIGQMDKELAALASAQSTTVDAEQLLGSFSKTVTLARKAGQSRMPGFAARYDAVKAKCVALIQRSPGNAAEWVRANRAKAWSPIGSELRPKTRIDDKELVDAVRRLKSVCQTGMDAQDKTVYAMKALGMSAGSVKGMDGLAREVKTTAAQASDLACVGQGIAKVKGEARQKIQEGLREIDKANRKIERYADLSALANVCSDWQSAQTTIASSRSILSSLPSFPKAHQTKTAGALVQSDRAKVDDILSKIEPHVERARSELVKAHRQESTPMGRAQRTVGRLFNRAKDRVSQSRIGKEVAVSFKAMVLGTKMFYDMMDMNSGTDMMQWATRYEKDMNQLMDEVETVSTMDGWSLTGKNTFIEDLTDKAYEKAFRQE